jgi:hypothetical protein
MDVMRADETFLLTSTEAGRKELATTIKNVSLLKPFIALRS